MEGLGKILVTDFVDKSVEYMEAVVTSIETEPLSFNRKVRLIQEVLMKGVTFGVEKGGYIERCRSEKVKSASDAVYRKWLQEMIYEINEVIEVEMKKKKYKKKL